jgi:hypothetical protein
LSEQGYRQVHLGASRAFLNDGVLQYKKKWGMAIAGERADGWIINALQDDAATRSFLINNPFSYENSGELCVAVFLEAGTVLGVDQMRRLYQQHHLAGTGTLVFHTFDALPSPEIVPDDLKNRIAFRRAGE